MGENAIGYSSSNAGAMHTAMNSVQALGRGFDVNFDTRLLYCKGIGGSRLVQIDEEHRKNLYLYDDVELPDVSRDVSKSMESQGRQSSGVKSFHEMMEYFNEKADISGNFPIGSFNSAFSFTGSKHIDAAATKTLSMDGFYIPLAKVQLMRSPLVLQENVKRAVPTCWDPSSLASFIENFGTHVITSVTIGGKDMIYVKQHFSSPLPTMDVKSYVQDIGNQRFSDAESHTSSVPMKIKDKAGDSGIFNSQGIYPQPTNTPYLTGKEDVTVIFRRRGGDDLEQNHTRWARTVKSSPDVIEMTFVPIIDLLGGLPGKEHLTRAIGLYLEYKPKIEELRYFLEFQIPRLWAPSQENFPGHLRKEPVCPSLHFSMMGAKLFVSQEQISVGRKPVTGMRLSLEGVKQNRLSIHIQHLAYLPKILLPYWDAHVPIGAPKWQGPEEQDSRWFEPIKWKNFSHVSSAPIESQPDSFIGDLSCVYIVTGAQLGVWDFGSRNVLYMKLLYSRLPGCTIRRSLWDHAVSENSRKGASVNNTNSGDSSSGSVDSSVGKKLLKFVDMSETCKGPQDPPGHWLVTGGKLGVEKGVFSGGI
ncbi:MAC/Perforin domain-containing protein [Euphorbia peplus]|nr:MAC/Perforin domain-containing protein [Euphorbia peplus]